ncbi:cyclic nucleotide-binding domain-containing protein [Streptomyces sp. NPDC051662]|uniref:Crp/Fnr family transcriptional regulator n=1 Tax=Streptomyces sp. NPDC051662 TaxID=3154750 RepID=UPI00343B7F27
MDVDRWWEKIFDSGRTLSYRSGQPMLLKGSQKGSVLRVVEGWALVTDPHLDGTRTFLELRGRGQLLGETSALSGGPRNADVTAVCRTVVRAVGSERFLAELRRNDVLVGMLLHAQELHRTTNVRAGLRRFGVVSGLSGLLLDLTRTVGAPVVVGIPQKVLACVLGVTPRTLYDAVAELERRGALSARWPVVHITDETVLRELAHSDE